MTNREFFNAIIANEAISEEVRAHATAALAKWDESLKKRAEKPSKAQEANKPLVEAIKRAFAENPKLVVTASTVAPSLNVSVQKASAILRGLADAGFLKRGEAKIPKKGKVVIYQANAEVETENAESVPETEEEAE